MQSDRHPLSRVDFLRPTWIPGRNEERVEASATVALAFLPALQVVEVGVTGHPPLWLPRELVARTPPAVRSVPRSR